VAKLALVLVLAVAAGGPPPPTVTGPRETESQRPVYGFHARGAVSFRCAFDTARLRRCPARYSQRLAPGAHVLRVRSVGRTGAMSRIVTVRVRVLAPVPALSVGTAVTVGPGAGVPAVGPDAVWVPTTTDGSLARVAGGAVASRTPFGTPPPEPGYLDSAVVAGGSVWAASDAGARIARVDRASGTVSSRVDVPQRPGGLTAGGGAVWAFHFLQGAITRLDATTGTASRLTVTNASATGIAFGGDALWLLTTSPMQVLEVDPATGGVRRTILLLPPFALSSSFIDSWWLAYGEGALWATLPSRDAVARIDTASGRVTYVRLRYGRPFGVAVGGASAWVATDRAIVRLDGTTAAVTGASALPPAERSGFASVAYGAGAAWVTNYDRGTLVRVTAG
jgi:virginiamycin B lyase